MLDKEQIHARIIAQLQADKAALERAANATREGATHEESAAEHRYDTRGLEASYLAGAQSKRAMEIEQASFAYQHLTIRSFGPNDPIALSALLQLESDKGSRWYFFGPKAGGMKIDMDGTQVTVVTPQSPLGEDLLGAELGDVIEIERPLGTVEYEIISVA